MEQVLVHGQGPARFSAQGRMYKSVYMGNSEQYNIGEPE